MSDGVSWSNQSSLDSKIVCTHILLVARVRVERCVLWDLSVVNECIADPLERFLRLDHISQEGSLEGFVVFGDIVLELSISTSNVEDNVISLFLNNNLRDTDQINISLHMDDRDSDLMLMDSLLHLLLKSVVCALLWNKWKRSQVVEKLAALVIKFLIREQVGVDFTFSKVLIH